MPKKEFNKNLIKLIQIFFVMVLMSLSTINLEKTNNNSDVLGTTTESADTIDQKITYLEEIIKRSSNYFDANIELSKLYLEKLDTENAIIYFNNAKNINPNASELVSLEKLILNKN